MVKYWTLFNIRCFLLRLCWRCSIFWLRSSMNLTGTRVNSSSPILTNCNYLWEFPKHSKPMIEASDSAKMAGSPIMAQRGCIFSRAVFLRCSLVGSQRPTERQRAELSWRSRLRRIFWRRAHIWMYPPIPPYIPPDAHHGGFSETLLMLT